MNTTNSGDRRNPVFGGIYDTTWTWITGENFNYANWQIGEGFGGSNINEVTVMNYMYGLSPDHEPGQWSDESRFQFVMYVLEIDSECDDFDNLFEELSNVKINFVLCDAFILYIFCICICFVSTFVYMFVIFLYYK